MPTWSCDRDGASALLDPIVIQRLVANPSRSSAGEVEEFRAENWETHCEEWAEVHFMSGTEASQPSQQVALRTWQLRVRQHATTLQISPRMRVVLPDGAVLNITAVGDPDRLRRWIEIDAREQAPS